MTIREPTTQRLQAIESELAHLRSIVGQQPALDHLPQQVRVARTVNTGGTYPPTGDTFAVIFRDEEFNEAEGANPLVGDDQTSQFAKFARTIPTQYVEENTTVLVAEIDGQHYIIATITDMGQIQQPQYQADCVADTTGNDGPLQGQKLWINKERMLRLAKPTNPGDDRNIIEIHPGPEDSTLQTHAAGIVWTQDPKARNLEIRRWAKFESMSASTPGTEIWLGVGAIPFHARHQLPSLPERSHQYLYARAVSGNCVAWDWFGPGLDCVVTAYECGVPDPQCVTLFFSNGLLVNKTGGAVCDPPPEQNNTDPCIDSPGQIFNPCFAP